MWNPIIVDTDSGDGKHNGVNALGPSGSLAKTANEETGCGKAKPIDGITVPATIRGGDKDTVRDKPGRDANGNIIVHFASDLRPGDNAVCWL